VFHAKALTALSLPPSKFYEHARDYFSGRAGFEQWAFVGLQGIADVAARLEEDDNAQAVAEAIPQLPPAPFEALAKCLENEALPTRVSEALAALIDGELTRESPDAARVALALRALSHAPAKGLVHELLKKLLKTGIASDINLLVSISGRCWEAFTDAELCHLYLEALAANAEGQEVFNKVLVDLFFIPGLREPVMDCLRSPDRSDRLAAAIGQFFSALRR